MELIDSWIVTLDVLKYYDDGVGNVDDQLNSNIRCIEIVLKV